MSVVTARDRRCLEGLARSMLPDGGPLPGGHGSGAGGSFARALENWDRVGRARLLWLLRAFDASPLTSRYARRFSSLSPELQDDWLQRYHRSRWTARRMHIAALKQLVFIAWASTPAVEDAFGYDYRCLRDDDQHGTTRLAPAAGVNVVIPEEPSDYLRPGPAVHQGSVPLRLMEKTSFEPRNSQLVTRSWPELEDRRVDRVDAVVIGSGAGGAVVAATLAEAGMSVIVVEEGPQVDATTDFTGAPFDRFRRFCRDGATTQVVGSPPIPLPLGRVVGGTTVVNSGTCFRAPEKVLRRWRNEHGIDHASTDDLDEHYSDIEAFLNVRPVPWSLLGSNGRIAHNGATELGYSGGPLLRNIADCHGCGQCAFGCPTDAKQAMHVSYLPRAHRAGAEVYARCRVERILIDDERATGVEATLLSADDRIRGTIRVLASHVVVCAGAIHSPALLEASGVPDPTHLTGRNLRIHPATGVGGIFPDDVVNWKGTLQSYFIDHFYDSHELMFEATTTVPGIGAGSIPGMGAEAIEELAGFRRLATLGFYVSDTSRGRVRTLRGRVVPTYRLNALDTRRMGLGLAIASEILLAAGAVKVYPGLPGMEAISTREDVARIRERSIKPGHLKLSAFHPMGTVRMGADEQASVVAPDGSHHFVRGLWVADASTFPTCVGVNPQMTIMAFARHTARQIAAVA